MQTHKTKKNLWFVWRMRHKKGIMHKYLKIIIHIFSVLTDVHERIYKSIIVNKQLIFDLVQRHSLLFQKKFNHYIYTSNAIQWKSITNGCLTYAENLTEVLSRQIREDFERNAKMYLFRFLDFISKVLSQISDKDVAAL